jgi:predicted enzyme related to lactoylglutathione lyase
MKPKSCELSWIVVNDLNQAKKFYTEVLGFKLLNEALEWNWLELQGHEGGMKLGIAGKDPHCPILPGQNAIVTIVVDNIEEAIKELKKKNVTLVGDIQEVPGHVKMQSFIDQDHNNFQLVEKIDPHA